MIKGKIPGGITRRAQYFIRIHGYRIPDLGVEQHRAQWLEHGIPSAEIDRTVAYQEMWGGIAHRGEAECMSAPQCRTATVYSGLDEWGLKGLGA
jgi:hypothetical protein